MSVSIKTSIYKDDQRIDFEGRVSQEGNGGEFAKDVIYTNDDGEAMLLQYTTKWIQTKLPTPLKKEG